MLLVIFLIALVLFCLQIAKHIQNIRRARPIHLKSTEILPRLRHTLKMAFGQSRVRERWWGFCHTIIFYAFLIFLIGTLELLVQSVCPNWQLANLLSEHVAAAIHLIQTYFAWLTLAAMTIIAGRRIVQKNKVHHSVEAWAILGLITGIMLAHIAVIAANIALKLEPAWLQTWLPITTIFSKMTAAHAQTLYTWGSIIHILCVAAFLIWIPRGKHLHIVFSFPSLYLQYKAYADNAPIQGCLTPDLTEYEAELEKALENDMPESDWPTLGAEKLPQLSQKQCLHAYACTQCQRCTNACPMVSAKLEQCAGPMQTMLKLRHLTAQKNAQNSALIAPPNAQNTNNAIMHVKELWNCTQCGACDRACPVGIEHTVRIVDLRRAAVCREQIPTKLHTVFAAQERTGNPWGYPKSKRMNWTQELNNHSEPTNPKANILLFAGCQASYDPTATQTLIKLTHWLNHQGYAVRTLKQETCCGEPMRKLGNETAFAQAKAHNLAQFEQIPHDLILTTCPHCAHTLQHEYNDDTHTHQVMHALAFIAEQWKAKNITLPTLHKSNAVFHMPCGLGKQDNPKHTQDILALIQYLGLQRPEPDVTQAHCCGAGGGQFFLDHARPMTNLRADELLQSQPQKIFTACPFCIQTITDAVNTKSQTPPQTLNILDMLLTLDVPQTTDAQQSPNLE